MSVGPYRFTQSPKGQLKGFEMAKVKFKSISADGSIDDKWTLMADKGSTNGDDFVEIKLIRELNEKVARRWREHSISLDVSPTAEFWSMVGANSSADLLSKAGSYLQTDWESLLRVCETFAFRFTVGCNSYGKSVDEIVKSNGQFVTYEQYTKELLFKIQRNGSGMWLKLSPELEDLMFFKLKVSSIEELVSSLKFRNYQPFGVLARFYGDYGREVNLSPVRYSRILPTLERGDYIPVVGTTFQMANFDEIRCRNYVAIGDNFQTTVELRIDPDNFQSKNGYAVQVLRNDLTLGFISDNQSKEVFNYLESVGGAAYCHANIYFSPAPEGSPSVGGSKGIAGNAIQLYAKIPQKGWIEDFLEDTDDSNRPQLMSFE